MNPIFEKEYNNDDRYEIYVLDASNKEVADELAEEVLQGLWGNGQERADRLREAGYDYDAVQKRVNEILYGSDPVYYTIQAGDTLSGIAVMFNTTVVRLCELNDITNPDLIYAGNTIRVR